jgi:cation transport ATPase
MKQKAEAIDLVIKGGRLWWVRSCITPEEVEKLHHLDWREIGRIVLVGTAAAITWSGVVPTFHGVDLVAFAVALIAGYPVFAKAISNLIARRMTMELSMTIALAAALAIREFFTTLIILLFVLIAEVLEDLAVDRGRRAIRTLLDLLPKRATVRRGGFPEERAIEELAPGDIVIIKPGSEIPVDEVVVHGTPSSISRASRASRRQWRRH